MSAAARCNVHESGAPDGQPMLFAHGFGCDQHMWRLVAPAFEADHRVIVFDHVGAGDSDLSTYDPDRYATLAGYATDVLEICEELDLRDVVFVGHSVSAMIGVLAAAEQPARFAKLVLIGPSPRYIDDGDYVGGFSEADITELLDSLESNYLGWSKAMAPVIMGASDRPELSDELTASFCRTDPEIARRFARATFLADNRDDLPKVVAPTLVVQSRHDSIAPVQVGAYVRDALPNGQLVVLETTGHCPHLSAPAETIDALVAFHRLTTTDLDLLPCGYLVSTPDGTLAEVNETFLAWTGHRRDELVGLRSFTDLLSAGGRIYHETHIAPTLHMQGHIDEIALELVCADGRRLPVLVNATLERDATGAAVAIRTAVFSAGQRRHYEQELLDAKLRAEESEQRATVLARTLQQTLIPPAPPQIEGLDVAAVYRPAGSGTEVGGDFYDVFEVSEGDWVAVVGDVCGKGAEAAVVTATARHALRTLAVREPDPSVVLGDMNDILLAGEYNRFCTLLVVRLRRRGERWTAVVASGGHPLPVLTGPSGLRRVGGRGSLVGAIRKVVFRCETTALEPGDALMVFTDGVTEARRGEDLYGDQRVEAWVRDHPGTAEAVTTGLLGEVLAFQRGSPRDDIVILAIRVPGAGPPGT